MNIKPLDLIQGFFNCTGVIAPRIGKHSPRQKIHFA